MESLDQLQHKLGSLQELRTIVKTMKALSAASIRQYEQAVTALATYYSTVERGLYVVLKRMESPSSVDRSARVTAGSVAVIFGSDHGLCGRFNEEIAGHAAEKLEELTDEDNPPMILAVGARVAASLEQQGFGAQKLFLLPGSATQITATVQRILLQIDQWRQQEKVDAVHLFYNRHSAGKGYQPVGVDMLPIDMRLFRHLENEKWPSNSLPTFSMKREDLLSDLLHQYLFVLLFRACAESQASEHVSRLAAMQSAQRNLDERLEEVTMVFRRARQNAITSELLDVVAGFEALTSEES